MIIKIKNIFIFLFFFVGSCVKLIINTLISVYNLNDVIFVGSAWFAAFYQPFIVLITGSLFAKKIDVVLNNFLNGEFDIISAFLLGIILIFIILLINALVELVFRIRYKNQGFDTFFSIQKNAHAYMMTIISLIAIYAAIDSHNANEINTMLLTCGILIFICIIITDLYKVVFLSQGIVEGVYMEFINSYNRYKK